MIEKRELLNEYFDMYGSLLTDKQQKYFILYHHEDLSLAEIAEEELISRNAVHDHVKRTQQLLVSYEEKLGLKKRLDMTRHDIKKISDIVAEIQDSGETEHLEMVRVYLNQVADNM